MKKVIKVQSIFYLTSMLLGGITACKEEITPEKVLDGLVIDTSYTRVEKEFSPVYPLNRFASEVINLSQKNLPQSNQHKILFYGSSSIVGWQNSSLVADMAPMQVVGNGFGGSIFPELSYYQSLLVNPYNPKSIVIYCENDLFNGGGKTVQQTFDDFAILITRLHKQFLGKKIYILSLKPSPARRTAWTNVKKLNGMIEKFCANKSYIQYIDISTAMFLPNGQIDGTIFVSDSLHMNAKGYAIWAKIVKPILLKDN